jgi:hypothetical protein
VYRLEDGKENEVEREFLFSASGSYTEMEADPALISLKFRVSEVFEGLVNGFWLCIFAFHADRPPLCSCIPSLLSISRYPPNSLSVFFFLKKKKLNFIICLNLRLLIDLSQWVTV